ncbi:hypothetical protein BJY52DRAFT_1416929 [Lactarius psammicola]|nr:hypothetical protein BJY52DRAFT_1416929 [Lactarius psammicola]
MSFLSVEPQSRVLLECHSDSLLGQFDTQLEIITDRYLAFFQERRRIEATYKAKTVDASFDPRVEPTTTRVAWDKVRDNLERGKPGASFSGGQLRSNNRVIWKKTKVETGKRIEENLKRFATKYADYAENTILKLQQEYLKKYNPRVFQRSQDISNKRFRGRRKDLWEPEPAKSEEGIADNTHGCQLGLLNKPSELAFDDSCRSAIFELNSFRSMWVENLRDGYECLEELVFAPIVKDVLVKYMDGMVSVLLSLRGFFENFDKARSAARAEYDNLAASTRAEVEKALVGTDTSDLRASFRRALSFSIPSPTLYRNYRPGAYSDLIFGVPLVDVETNEDNVPKVMRMCIEEVEKRGLDTKGIYSLRRRFESQKSFSFSSTDDIHSVAMLLKRYLWDLPEPLFMLSLQDYRNYRQNRGIATYTENDFSLLRSKIRELHPFQRASLEVLLRHLLHVASHSDSNAMTVEELAIWFRLPILRGNPVLQDSVETLVIEDLIRNVHTLFEERSSPSPPVPSSLVAETTPTFTSSSLPWSPKLLQPTEVQTIGSTTRHRPGLVGGTPTSTQSYFSSLLSDASMESRLTPSLTPLLSPLQGPPSLKILTEGVETTTREQVIPEARGTQAVETLANSTPAEVVSVPLTSVAEWRLRQSRLPLHPEAVTIPQSPPESVLSLTSDFSLSSVTSTHTGVGRFSP